jgi:hypothetical protein
VQQRRYSIEPESIIHIAQIKAFSHEIKEMLRYVKFVSDL